MARRPPPDRPAAVPRTGPASGCEPGPHRLAPGLWLTSGRAAVLEGRRHLAVLDPGDEPAGTRAAPRGPLADVLALVRDTGKPVRWLLVTHAHPDHVANLDLFRHAWQPPPGLVAHAASPLRPERALATPGPIDDAWGVTAHPTPGHSPWGDDLTFWCAEQQVVFTGDLVQPKGETWGQAFYPSPFPYFTDGDVYARSLERVLALPFTTLVTGHREVRRGASARHWVELTLQALQRVAAAVDAWDGPARLGQAGPAIYRALCRERGIPTGAIDARLAAGPAGQPSAFERFDLPGIRYYWERRFGGHGAPPGEAHP